MMAHRQIYYSDKYFHEHDEYRALSKQVPKTHLMSEEEWRRLGIQQSLGWVHYMIHEPEPHILLFRRPLQKSNKNEGLTVNTLPHKLRPSGISGPAGTRLATVNQTKNPAMEQGSETFYCDENTFANICKFMTTLGRGATAAVKLAFHMPTLTYVAVKITVNMKRYSAHNINEADIIKSLVHPCIIKLFQEVQTWDMTYLIMEYASKGDLMRHIRRPGGIQVCEARRLFTQVLQAVKYCHENNVVHRDIKASNILLDFTGNAKFCDFGLAVKLVPGNKLKNFCGTLANCAPEIFGVEPYDGYASDVWALGVLLYFMVAGRVPFQATSWGLRQQIMAANFNVPPHVPIDIFNVIVELLLISPDRRPTIHQILTRPMIRDSQAQASSIQSLPGTPSPNIVGTMTGMGYKRKT